MTRGVAPTPTSGVAAAVEVEETTGVSSQRFRREDLLEDDDATSSSQRDFVDDEASLSLTIAASSKDEAVDVAAGPFEAVASSHRLLRRRFGS